MGLVNHDKAEPGKEPYPFGMVGQNPRMEHVRVGNDDPAGVPGGKAQTLRGVAVIGGNFDIELAAA